MIKPSATYSHCIGSIMQESLVLQKGIDGICNVLFELSICHILANFNRQLNVPILDVVEDQCFQRSAPV